jgi:hypothetical protein
VAASGQIASVSVSAELGETVAALRAESTLPIDFTNLPVFFTDTPANIRWITHGQIFEFDNVGGTGESTLDLNVDGESRLTSVGFSWENRPLNLRR